MNIIHKKSWTLKGAISRVPKPNNCASGEVVVFRSEAGDASGTLDNDQDPGDKREAARQVTVIEFACATWKKESDRHKQASSFERSDEAWEITQGLESERDHLIQRAEECAVRIQRGLGQDGVSLVLLIKEAVKKNLARTKFDKSELMKLWRCGCGSSPSKEEIQLLIDIRLALQTSMVVERLCLMYDPSLRAARKQAERYTERLEWSRPVREHASTHLVHGEHDRLRVPILANGDADVFYNKVENLRPQAIGATYPLPSPEDTHFKLMVALLVKMMSDELGLVQAANNARNRATAICEQGPPIDERKAKAAAKKLLEERRTSFDCKDFFPLKENFERLYCESGHL